MKLIKALVTVTLGSALFACSSTHEPSTSSEEVTTTVSTPKLEMAEQGNYSGSDDLKVNGETPYGKVGGKSKTLLKQTDSNGITRVALEITRDPGYRSPVHYMNYAVTSCVVKGEATMELDGKEPQYFSAGQCFIMPVGIKGFIANDGKSVLKLIDYNTFPEGEKTATMLEIRNH